MLAATTSYSPWVQTKSPDRASTLFGSTAGCEAGGRPSAPMPVFGTCSSATAAALADCACRTCETNGTVTATITAPANVNRIAFCLFNGAPASCSLFQVALNFESGDSTRIAFCRKGPEKL